MLEKLKRIRESVGSSNTQGLPDDVIERFLEKDELLGRAIAEAEENFQVYQNDFPELLKMPDNAAIEHIQDGVVNFYPELQVNPYISLAAKGPWVVTLHGAVLHDSGGYGMLGLGHGPDSILEVLSKNHVMANVMTPSLSHKKLINRLIQEIGRGRKDQGKIFEKFLFMNSGSEAVTVALRIADLNAKIQTDQGGPHQGKSIKILAHAGGFHGRTDRPAQASDSTYKACRNLASFREKDNLLRVEINDTEGLKKIFEKVDQENLFVEMFLMEPVMGEGNPGAGVTSEYYNLARKLTKERGTLLLVDSIQAGLRAHGCLSIVDYPGFESVEPPDCETYSKALNAGQYPLSVLAMTNKTASIYLKGVYGNTMTANPRALEVACMVLDQLSEGIRKNIQDRGQEFIEKFKGLQEEFPRAVTGVSGTGLLCALHLSEDGYQVVGAKGVELLMRQKGIGVIHGGKNALRFTPHFQITSAEIDLVISVIRDALKLGPVFE